MKSYYQILLKRKKNKNDLLFWILPNKIEYKNKIELEVYIKKNCSILKSYKDINSIVAVEITEKQYNEFVDSYKSANVEIDFITLDESE